MKIIEPLHDRVVAIRVEDDDSISGHVAAGILQPETTKEKPIEGIVVAVGPGRTLNDGRLLPPSIKVGDRILFAKYGGTDVQLELQGQEYIILREDEIMGVIKTIPDVEDAAPEYELSPDTDTATVEPEASSDVPAADQ
jgi:chaperonin GroES